LYAFDAPLSDSRGMLSFGALPTLLAFAVEMTGFKSAPGPFIPDSFSVLLHTNRGIVLLPRATPVALRPPVLWSWEPSVSTTSRTQSVPDRRESAAPQRMPTGAVSLSSATRRGWLPYADAWGRTGSDMPWNPIRFLKRWFRAGFCELWRPERISPLSFWWLAPDRLSRFWPAIRCSSLVSARRKAWHKGLPVVT